MQPATDERAYSEAEVQAAREFLLLITRSYLNRQGTSKDLELRSRIMVNGILGALEREDLEFSAERCSESVH